MKYSIYFFFFFSTQILFGQDEFVKCEYAPTIKPAANSLIYYEPVVDEKNALNANLLFLTKVVAESKDWVKITYLYNGCVQDGYILRKDALLNSFIL